MNGTALIYTPVQQAMLPLVGGVICPLMSWAAYRISRRRLRLKDTLKTRAFLFYRILAGVLLGQFLCHTLIPGGGTLDVKYMFCFVLGGCLLVDLGELLGRLWNTNCNYMGPLDEFAPDEVGLDKERMEKKSVVVAADLSSNDFAETVWTVEDNEKDERKRNWILVLLLVIFAVISVMDGLLLVYRNPPDEGQIAATIVCYYVNGIFMSISVFGAMIHAKLHVAEEMGPRIFWWCLFSGVWIVTLVCSSLPVLVGAQLSVVQSIVNDKALLAFYGLASGCVLSLQQYYYHYRKLEKIDKRWSIAGFAVFALAAGQSAVTGFWL